MYTLTITTIVCLLVSFSYQGDPKEEFEKQLELMQAECMKETNAKKELIEKSMKGEFTEDKDLKCYIKCMFIQLGYMKATGELNGEFMKEHPRPGADPAKIAGAVDKCKDPRGADTCERAFNFGKCAHEFIHK